MKVFVLIKTSLEDCIEEVSCMTFSSKEKAIEQMRLEYEKAADKWDGDDWICEIDDKGASRYPDGYYDDVHINWTIQQSIVY